MNKNLQNIIGLLLEDGGGVTYSRMTSLLNITEEEIKSELEQNKENLLGYGINLIMTENEVAISTNEEISALIKEENNKDSKELSKASAETLSIILYFPGVTRSQLDFIRGVNTSFIIRNLEIRGLVRKVGKGRVSYEPTVETLAHLGVSRVEELPKFEEVNKNLTNAFVESND
jgi:segregation and condensation protein B